MPDAVFDSGQGRTLNVERRSQTKDFVPIINNIPRTDYRSLLVQGWNGVLLLTGRL
jgi:hypothetical protein